jgi:hypothetical protein
MKALIIVLMAIVFASCGTDASKKRVRVKSYPYGLYVSSVIELKTVDTLYKVGDTIELNRIHRYIIVP